MKKKLILAAVLIGGAITGALALMPAREVAAVELGDDPICREELDEWQREAAGCDKKDAATGNVAQNIINWVVAVLGVVAVIFIIIGGVQYTISQGDPGKTKKAKDTIFYALMGLLLAVLAFTIVNFVLANILTSNSGQGQESGQEQTTEAEE